MVNVLAHHQNSHIVAHGHDGAFYAASAPVNKIGSLKTNWDTAVIQATGVINRIKRDGLMSRPEANAAFHDAILRDMSARNHIGYMSSTQLAPALRNELRDYLVRTGVSEKCS